MNQLRSELERLRRACARIDRQTATVLVAAPLFVFLHLNVGSRKFFYAVVAGGFSTELGDLPSWVWRFGVQGLTGFVAPALILTVVFRVGLSRAGLGVGDWRFALKALFAYLPLVIAGTWILSSQDAFQRVYPHFRGGIENGSLLLAYEATYLLYWIGWEYLWRGFVLFGTAHTFGVYSILIQAVPFALLHASKPVPEQMLSIVGGIALGAVVWRARSFWIAVPIHAVQMALIDIFCAQRIRTGIRGLSPSDLIDLFH
ncbi:MAG TPA: CPBP family intramembrane glutamic endopeptidase [Rhodothermales bacterium]|nr:CPBP family intramembrane glutamic endopeptidase [Rhodothermales bacterium]